MHFVLQCRGTSANFAIPEPPDDETRSWKAGARFTDPPTKPIIMEWDPDEENLERIAYYPTNPVLMTRELVQALFDAGVHNLDTYEVIIRSPSGAPDCTDYLAVNIIGAIAAADMDQSETIDLFGTEATMINVDFESLVIDEKKAEGHLLFRLGECVTAVIIDESVVDQLNSKGGFGLTFLDPEDFCG